MASLPRAIRLCRETTDGMALRSIRYRPEHGSLCEVLNFGSHGLSQATFFFVEEKHVPCQVVEVVAVLQAVSVVRCVVRCVVRSCKLAGPKRHCDMVLEGMSCCRVVVLSFLGGFRDVVSLCPRPLFLRHPLPPCCKGHLWFTFVTTHLRFVSQLHWLHFHASAYRYIRAGVPHV